jgi:aminoglycoside 3-N-acetyltransferase
MKKHLPNFIKNPIKKIIKQKKFKDFKKEAEIISKSDLMLFLRKSGIVEGDDLFIHSSLKGLGYIENGPATLINALKEVVGEEGTLVFPTFTINSSMHETLTDPNHVFNVKTSVSTVGAITNEFLKTKGIKRSLHPTHSVAAWGKNAEFICQGHHLADTNFGVGTPFEKFLSLNGKLVGIGINYAPVTFYHVFEDLNLELFPDVYLKTRFNGVLINNHGEKISTQILCHNPEFHKTRIEKDPAVEYYFRTYFEEKNVSKSSQIGHGNLWWMHTKDLLIELKLLNERGVTIYHVPK